MIVPSGPKLPGVMKFYMVSANALQFSPLLGDYSFCFPDLFMGVSYFSQGNMPIPPEQLLINGQPLVLSFTNYYDGFIPWGGTYIWGETIISAPAGALAPLTMTTANSDYNDYTFEVRVSEISPPLVDNNRDGQISLDGSDDTTPAKPFRFWVNDSKESGDDESSVGADDQIPGQPSTIDNGGGIQIPNANYANDQINGRSDLVNFFPVALCLSNILQWLPPASGFEYHLLQADSAVKFVYTSLMPTNAFDYLTNLNSFGYGTNSDEWVTNADTIQVTNILPGIVLDTNWLAQVQANGGNGVILMEGCTNTTQPLWLEIWHKDQAGNNKLMGGTPLYLNISSVEQMFRHLNLCAYGNGTVDPSNASRAFAPNEPETPKNKNLVFLHGYNVNQQQARGVESEMFKRFYWSGSKAKFYGVTWNGAVSQGDMSGGGVIAGLKNVSCNLQTNIVNAFLTAPHLADFLKYGLSGETTVVAHSLGNMVCLSAINDYHAPINKYFMIDSAVAIEAIDGSTDINSNMIYPEWSAYDNRLRASEWYNLFPGDARGALTWRDRLSDLSSAGAVYNFYSIGEEVLRDFAGTPPSDLTSSINDILAEMSVGTDKAAYAWVWQEKDKGRMSGNNFISSNHGGWAFNYYYYPMLPGDASLLADSQLQINAFFDFSSDFTDGIETVHGTMPGTGSNQADMALYGSGGSTYAQANRNRILSDAIPALTLPAGANPVPRLQAVGRNFNMSSTVFENSWPSGRPSGEASKWHHSDFGYVAYPFTYKLFNKITTLGNLN